jgi:hypothetical protein
MTGYNFQPAERIPNYNFQPEITMTPTTFAQYLINAQSAAE